MHLPHTVIAKVAALLAVLASGALGAASAEAAIWTGTKADARALTHAIETDPNYFGCNRPVGYEHLVDIRISNDQKERGVDYVARAYQRAPKGAQGCEIIFEHRQSTGWRVLTFGSSPCARQTGRVAAACRVLYHGRI